MEQGAKINCYYCSYTGHQWKKKINSIITSGGEEERATLKRSSITGYSSHRGLALHCTLGKGRERGQTDKMIHAQQLAFHSSTSTRRYAS